MHQITFNDIPEILQKLYEKIESIENQLIFPQQQDKDSLLTIEELCDYLPGRPAKQTVYGWVNNRIIEFERHGKRLYFRKSVIDAWLKNGRQKKNREIQTNAKRRVS
jgi:excisionase family DNA binding protein